MTDIVERLRAPCSCGLGLREEAADEIERLLRLCQDMANVQQQNEQTYEKAADEIERLRALLKECAEELADQVEGQYALTKGHPAMKRRYDRDMQPVLDARAALEKKP